MTIYAVVVRYSKGDDKMKEMSAVFLCENEQHANEVRTRLLTDEGTFFHENEVFVAPVHVWDRAEENFFRQMHEYNVELGVDDGWIAPGEAPPLHDYQVQWEVDEYAASPVDAARQAWEIMRDDGSLAHVFVVTGEDGTKTRVDLDDVEPA